VFTLALDLLDRPQELYRKAGPQVRQMLNRTIFTKLKLDGRQIMCDELAEPFDVLVSAGRTYARRAYHRARTPQAAFLAEDGLLDDMTLTDLLELALMGTGSSKSVMVELRGFEPLTPSMPWRCATSCATAPPPVTADCLPERS
jgi:site-specific DNA recombinase